MNSQTFGLPVDKTLTPATATRRRFTLVCDVFPQFVEENREVIQALLADGCVLGVASPGNRDEALGLYRPLPRSVPA
jgi:hypothetical protein